MYDFVSIENNRTYTNTTEKYSLLEWNLFHYFILVICFDWTYFA